MFAFQDNLNLVSYIPKKNKNVLLLPSLQEDAIDRQMSNPEIFMNYNATKGGVDMVDKLYSTYNCTRRIYSWPMVLICAILNIADVNPMF